VTPFVFFPLWFMSKSGFRWELLAVLIGFLCFAFGGPRLGRIFAGAYPIGMVGILYESMRPLRNLGLTVERVHIADMHAADIAILPIAGPDGPVSASDWLQTHSSRVLDAICAVPYGTFIFVSIAFAIFAFRRDMPTMLRFGWAFFTLNLVGFVTYHVFPAAPPWYFHAHGVVADLTAKASEGPNLARVDAMLGFPYFQGMYGRSSDIFGAMPSLHVAYPLLIAIEGWKLWGKPLRAASIAFFVWMCFSAVYLDHHWIVDVIAGIAYTAIVATSMRLAFRAIDRLGKGAEVPTESAAEAMS
jgi:membrane-associated phospholipid phosphatase